MTIREVHDIINTFLEVREEYLEPEEISRNLNTAQFIVVKDHFYNEHMKQNQYQEPPKAFEQTQYNSSDFSPIIEDFTDTEPPYMFLDGDGRITYNEIKDEFPITRIFDQGGVVDERKCSIFHMASMMWLYEGKWRKIRWERHNDIAQVQNDPFFRPTNKYPYYIQNKDYYQVFPREPKILRLSVVREPKFMWLDESNANNDVHPELPDSVMYDVIFRTLQLSGIQVRENEFTQMMERQENRQ